MKIKDLHTYNFNAHVRSERVLLRKNALKLKE